MLRFFGGRSIVRISDVLDPMAVGLDDASRHDGRRAGSLETV